MKFQKGVSGNPHGRPKKGNTFNDIIEKELNNICGTVVNKNGLKKTVNGKHLIARSIINIALDTNVPPNVRLTASKLIIERIDGLPMQAVDVTGIDNDNVVINFVEPLAEE